MDWMTRDMEAVNTRRKWLREHDVYKGKIEGCLAYYNLKSWMDGSLNDGNKGKCMHRNPGLGLPPGVG